MNIEIASAEPRDVAKYDRLDAQFHIALRAARRGLLPDVPELHIWLKLSEPERQLIIACWVEYAEQRELERRFLP